MREPTAMRLAFENITIRKGVPQPELVDGIVTALVKQDKRAARALRFRNSKGKQRRSRGKSRSQ